MALQIRESNGMHESMGDIVIVYDAANCIIEANSFASQTIGTTRERLIGNPLHEINMLNCLLQKRSLSSDHSMQGQEFTYTDHQGVQKRYITTFTQVCINGEYCTVLSMHAMCPERNIITPGNKNYFELLIEKAPDGVVLINKTGTMTFASPSARRMFGYTDIDSEQLSPSALTHPDDLPHVLEILEKVTQNPSESYKAEYRFLHKNGQWRWVESTFSNQFGEPAVEAIVINFRDVTARKEMEQVLSESEARFRIMAENSHNAICTVDTRGKIQWLNHKLMEISGFTQAQLYAAESFKEFIAEESIPFVMGNFLKFINGEDYEHYYKFYIVRADGEKRLLEKYMTDYVDQRGNRILLINMLDITETASLEEQLRQAQKLESFGQLAGGIAHDFNNILTVILGYGEEILYYMPSTDPNYREIEEIVKAGQKAASLTRQLLIFSSKQLMQPHVVNVCKIVIDLNKILSRLIGENIKVVTRLEEEPFRIIADPIQIEQIFFNLAVNARDAMPNGGELTIEVENEVLHTVNQVNGKQIPAGKYLKIIVTDNGIGMSPNVVARIYEPFFTTKQVGRGTGLGLSTVHGIVRQVNGYITVASELGVGTTFTVFIPQTEKEAMLSDVIDLQQDMQGNGELILVVEDELALRKLIKKLLGRIGYRVVVMANADQALRRIKLQNVKPALLLTDVIMPGLNGKQLADLLSEEMPDLKVLFMSGYTDDAIAQHGVISPEIPFIQKPFSNSALAHKIKQLLMSDVVYKKTTNSILMIDDDEGICQLVKRACLRNGYNFFGVESLGEALKVLKESPIHVILIDINLPGTDGYSVIKTIRESGYKIPAIALTGELSQIDRLVLNQNEVFDIVEKSTDFNPLIGAIMRIIQN